MAPVSDVLFLEWVPDNFTPSRLRCVSDDLQFLTRNGMDSSARRYKSLAGLGLSRGKNDSGHGVSNTNTFMHPYKRVLQMMSRVSSNNETYSNRTCAKP